MIFYFAAGIAFKYLIDYFRQLKNNKFVPGEEEACKECKFYKTVVDVIENVEIVD